MAQLWASLAGVTSGLFTFVSIALNVWADLLEPVSCAASRHGSLCVLSPKSRSCSCGDPTPSAFSPIVPSHSRIWLLVEPGTGRAVSEPFKCVCFLQSLLSISLYSHSSHHSPWPLFRVSMSYLLMWHSTLVSANQLKCCCSLWLTILGHFGSESYTPFLAISNL